MSSYRCPLIVVGVGAGFVLVGAIPVAVTFAMNSQSSAKIIGMGFVGFGILLLVPGLFWCVVVRALHGFKRWRRRSIRGRQQDGTGSRDGLGDAGVDRSSVSSGDGCGGPAGGASCSDGKIGVERSSTGQYYTSDAIDGEDGIGEYGCQNDDGRGVRRTSSKSDAESRRHQRRNRSWPSSYSEPPALIVSDGLVCQATTQPRPSSATENRDAQVTGSEPNGEVLRDQQQSLLPAVSPPIIDPSIGQNDVFIDVVIKCDDQRPTRLPVDAVANPPSPLTVLSSPPRAATGSPALSKSIAGDSINSTPCDVIDRPEMDSDGRTDADDVRMERAVSPVLPTEDHTQPPPVTET